LLPAALAAYAAGPRALQTATAARAAADARAAVDEQTGGWPRAAASLLAAATAAGGNQFIVTSGPLLPSLAKLAAFGLPVPRDALTTDASGAAGKAAAFAALGIPRHAHVCVVGNGTAEEAAAAGAGWAFVRVAPAAAGRDLGAPAASPGAALDALGRQGTPLPRLTLADIVRAARGAG